MDLQILLTAIIALAIIELASDVLKKTPFWLSRQCVAAFQRLWQENKLLHGIIDDNESFAAWRPEAAQYVALHAKAEGASQGTPQPVLDLLESFLKRGEPAVLLGESGAGKTTALQALTYRLARRACRANRLLWFGLPLVAGLLLFVAPAFSLTWLASFFLWEAFARRATVPLFLEARSYEGEDIDDWCNLEGKLGEKPLFSSRHRVVVLVDGVNEVKTSCYETFVENWRAALKSPHPLQVIFTGRADKDPTPRLGLSRSNTLTVQPLDDNGVREFLQVYGRRKAADEGKSYPPEQATHDFAELQNKKLLDEKSIGRNPYWLQMMVISGLHMRNRGALFRHFAEKLITREIEEKPEERKRKHTWEKIVPLDIEMDALAGLALAMHREQSIGFTGEAGWQKARTAIGERLGDDLPYSPGDVLGEAEATTLVRTQYKESVEFSHPSLQEFFAAYALRLEDNWDEALRHCEDQWWWETLFLLGSLLNVSESGDSPEAWARFTRRVLGDGQNDWRLFLAIGLLQSAEAPGEGMIHIVSNALVASMGKELTETRVQAINKLTGALGEEVAEAFAPLLRDRDSDIQKGGIAILRTVGGKRAAELLLRTLYAPDLHGVGAAALIAIGEPAIEPLIAVVVDPVNLAPMSATSWDYDYNEVFERAARALAQIGTPAIESLIAVLRGEVEIIQYGGKLAARTFIEIIGRPIKTVTVVTPSDEYKRQMVVKALGQLGIVAVEPLIRVLPDEDVGVREGVVEALGNIGAPAVSALIGALQDQEWRVRLTAAYALGQIGDSRAIEPLIVTLQDRDWRVRATAARALGQISDPSALWPLDKAMRDRVKSVRLEAAAILSRTGDPRAIGLLIDALGSRDWRIRKQARESIAKVGSRAVEMLIPILWARNWRKRFDAVYTLGQIGDSRAVEPLIAVLQSKNHGISQWLAMLSKELANRIERWPDDNDSFLRRQGLHKVGLKVLRNLGWGNATEELRQEAAIALGQIGSAEAIGALSTALGDENVYLRVRAVDALEQIGDPRAVEPLVTALQDEDAGVRARAAAALGNIGDPRAVEPLIAILQDEDRSIDWWKVYWKAVEALGKIGDPRAVGPALNGWCLRTDSWSRDGEKDVAKALGKIGTPAVEPLIAALQDKNWCVRSCATVALGNIGNPRAVEPVLATMRDEGYQEGRFWEVEKVLVRIGAPAVKPLIAALRDENKYVRSCARWALVEIGAPAVKPLIATLRDPHVGARKQAAQALGEIGDPCVVTPLIAALRDPNMDVRWEATLALGKIGAPAVEPLIAVLQDDEVSVRYAAAMVLGDIGDPRAVEPLITALRDEEGNVRWQTELSLGKIGVPAIRPLIAALRGEDWRVVQMVAGALGRIGDIAVEPLIVVLRSRSEDSQVRQGAAIALGKIGDPRAVKSLLATLQDKGDNVRYEAVRALGQIGDPRALPELERLAREDTGKALQGDVADAAYEAAEKIRQQMQRPRK